MGISVQGIKPYYIEPTAVLFYADTFDALAKMTPECVDMIFADPPYFLSNDGISCSGGKQVSVNKGIWDKIGSLEEKHAFNRKWIRLCKRVLKPHGTIWISGTLHGVI